MTNSKIAPEITGKTARLGYRRSTEKLSRAIDQPRANRPDIARLHFRPSQSKRRFAYSSDEPRIKANGRHSPNRLEARMRGTSGAPDVPGALCRGRIFTYM